MIKKTLPWVIAVLITLTAVFYQRLTGPTHPKRITISLADKEHKIRLLRSHSGDEDAEISVVLPDKNIKATLFYKVFPPQKNAIWNEVKMSRSSDSLLANLPQQQMAGKLMYYIELQHDNKKVEVANSHTPIIIRFTGGVPAWAMIPHIILMFFAMFLSNAAGIFAVMGINKYKIIGILAFITLFLGGMIFGPIVQKFAFDEFWAGVPFAWDLTDNKTLVAVLFWAFALWTNRTKPRPALTIVAAIVMLAIYAIPHSMYGSELDPETGEIRQAINVMRFFYDGMIA